MGGKGSNSCSGGSPYTIRARKILFDGIAYFAQEMMTGLVANKGFACTLKDAFC